MDLQALSEMNKTLTDNLNKMKENSVIAKKDSNTNKKDNIVLARKGDSGYVKCFDIDNDGEITLEEFNQYCEENGVSEKEKLKILSLMSSAKTNSKLVNKASEMNTEDTENEKVEGAIYARKGDDKYNEAMDTDRNNVVTYKEYIEYCRNRAKNSENSANKNEATEKYSQTEHFNEEEEISVDTEA